MGSKKKGNRSKNDAGSGGKSSTNSSGGFQSMGFSWQILKSIINSGYKQPTPIQRKAIPEILTGKDVVAMARTGSGKTAAFLLPMFQRLQERNNNNETMAQQKSRGGPRALIMSPTRELALQTFKFAKQFGKYADFKVAVILGGDKIEDQFETMHENPDIIIATPGRFLHICVEMNLKLTSIEYVVFDEADRLFEMGFKEQLNEILNKLPESRQTLLFSATLPQSLVEFARAGLQNPSLIRLDTEAKLSDKLRLAFFQCRLEDKLSFLVYLLEHVIRAVKVPKKKDRNESEEEEAERKKLMEQTMIFVATKHHVEFLRELLMKLGYEVAYAYSSLDQAARQANLAKFRAKQTSILIVTDVAARGLDIPKLDNVINCNFPAKAKLFVHRVGRVARAGNYGNAYSLVANDELPYMYELFEYLDKPIRFASDDMNPNDWNEVFGSIPQSILDIEKDELKSIIDNDVDLKSAFQVQENAYKHYLKSRALSAPASIRWAKNIRSLHPSFPVHPLLKSKTDANVDGNSINDNTESDLLEKLKNFQTKSTIFEINKTSTTKSANIMRKKRQLHERLVSMHKNAELNLDELGNKLSVHSEPPRRGGKKRKNAEDEEEHENANEINNNTSKSFRDEEHYIPYKPKNYNTEKALGINTNFNREMNEAALDLVADDQSEMRRNMQKTKWDRKKKKFVSTQSLMEKAKKIKTESGSYIKASYKKDLYSKWLKNYKALDREEAAGDDHDDESEKGHNQRNNRNKKFFGSSRIEKRYMKKLPKSDGYKKDEKGQQNNGTNKKKRISTGLKTKEQILKERKRKAKVQKFQNKRKKSSSAKASKGWNNKKFKSKR